MSGNHRRHPQTKNLKRKICIIVVFFVIILVFAGFVLRMADAQTKQQGAYTLRSSITDAIVQCYAIEGQYPASLEYLEENYGISINKDNYDVFYNVFASNIPPSIEVRVKA